MDGGTSRQVDVRGVHRHEDMQTWAKGRKRLRD